MDLHKFSQSLEHIIYDFLMWVIFFPYTLWRTLTRPLAMSAYIDTELEKGEAENRFNGLSPPFFLFLCVVLAWLFSHPPTAVLDPQPSKSMAGQILASPQNLVLFRLIMGCTFPLLGALAYEWLTPGGISHGSFRKPFYHQVYICAPFTFLSSVASSYATLSSNLSIQWVSGSIALAITLWFIITQTRYFATRVGRPIWLSVLLALGILILGWCVGLGAAWVLLGSANLT